MALEESLVAIRSNETGQNVGAGVLVDKGQTWLVLTCAHVVNAALGKAEGVKDPPKEEIFSLTLFGAPQEVLKAKLYEMPDAWDPMNGGKDLCVLRITGNVTNGKAKPALLADLNPIGNSFRAAGFPQYWQGDYGVATGKVEGQDEHVYLLIPDEATRIVALSMKTGLWGTQDPVPGEISPGFSGGPVEVRGQIVGLVTAARPPKQGAAYMVPASSFPASLSPLIRSYSKAIDGEYPHAVKLRAEIESRRGKMYGANAPFDIRIRLVESFADALNTYTVSGDSQIKSEYERGVDLTPAEFARHLGIGKDSKGNGLSTVLLHAPGGAGKSSFLMELLYVAADFNLVPFLLDFSRPATGRGPGDQEDPDDGNDGAEKQLTWWSRRYQCWGSPSALCKLGGDASGATRALLVVDGLNQANILWWKAAGAIDSFSKGELSGAVIVIADRLVKRDPEPDFRRAVIPPLPPAAYEPPLPEELRRAAESDSSWRSILSSSLLLNKAILMSASNKFSGGQAAPSRFSILDQYFREGECGFDKQEMAALSDFAYEVYANVNGTAFDDAQLEKLYASAPSLKPKVVKADLVQKLGGGQSQLQHQILHDQLAALKVASATKQQEEVLWRASGFDVLSLHSASSDAIELAFEAMQYPDRLLSSEIRKDLNPWSFLTDLYDWNYRIVLECVASLDRRREPLLRPWMRHAVYGLNLERAFDPFLYTSLRTDQLRMQIPQAPDLTYLDAKSVNELREKVSRAISDDGVTTNQERQQLERWRNVYTRETRFSSTELDPLWGDPLLSWTAANVIRRLGIDETVTDELLRLYTISRATSDSVGRAQGFRWRLVHTLGRADTSALKFLMEVAFDSLEGQHVRYGAIRSLVELTALSASQSDQSWALGEIKNRLAELFPQAPSPGAGGNRRLLRQCCAFNEPYVHGRVGWFDDWITNGLPGYIEILREGAKLAAERPQNRDEVGSWSRWAETADKVSDENDRDRRLALWRDALGND